jgi:hypothetical protein
LEDGRNEAVVAPETPPLPKEPSAYEKIQRLLDRNTTLKNPITGEAKPFLGRGSLGLRLITNKAAFEEIKARFDSTKDASGKSMTEVCRNYWENRRRGRN